MHIAFRRILAGACTGIAMTAACSGSSPSEPAPPPQQTAAELAAHFDSLYAAVQLLGPAYASRWAYLYYLEVPAAWGALPATVDVTTATGDEQWKGYVYEERQIIGGETTEGDFRLVVYRDDDVHTMIQALYGTTGALYEATLLTSDTLVVYPLTADGTTSHRFIAGSCTRPTRLMNAPVVPDFLQSCVPATFRTSLTMTLPNNGSIPLALTSLTFANATLSGEYFADTVVTSGRRVATMH